jgi:DNA-binding NarL/FixJ family response regulator
MALVASTVVVAEPHPGTCRALTAILEADGELRVVTATDRSAALRSVAVHHAGELLISHRLLLQPGASRSPLPPVPAGTRVIVLGLEVHPGFARQAAQAGADGYVIKDRADSELLPLLRTLLEETTA